MWVVETLHTNYLTVFDWKADEKNFEKKIKWNLMSGKEKKPVGEY